MGKRSDFERVDKDYYRTFDKRAGEALRPFLDTSKRYAEPFAGAGDLLDQFPELIWKVKSDISPNRDDITERDAFDVDLIGIDVVLTNPVWSRDILHKAIRHFASQVETIFLFDSDWAFTKQAQELLNEYCTHIIPIGRLKWMPGTSMSGKDSCSWYVFSPNKTEPTQFVNKIAMKEL